LRMVRRPPRSPTKLGGDLNFTARETVFECARFLPRAPFVAKASSPSGRTWMVPRWPVFDEWKHLFSALTSMAKGDDVLMGLRVTALSVVADPYADIVINLKK
jgi:hypothetical protein